MTTWDEYAAGWDDNEAVRAYSRAAYGCLQRLEEESRFEIAGARILDFGCGTGLLTEQLATRADWVLAIDTSQAMVEVLRTKVAGLGLPNVAAIAGSLESVSGTQPGLVDMPFDLVVCSSVCAFLKDYPGTVARLGELLRRGGWFVQWDWELNADDPEPFGLTRVQVMTALTDAGLANVQVDTVFEIESDGQIMRPLMGLGQSDTE